MSHDYPAQGPTPHSYATITQPPSLQFRNKLLWPRCSFCSSRAAHSFTQWPPSLSSYYITPRALMLCYIKDLFLFTPRLTSPTCSKFQNLQIPLMLWDSTSISLARPILSNIVTPSNMAVEILKTLKRQFISCIVHVSSTQ